MYQMVSFKYIDSLSHASKKKKLCKNNFDITVPKPKWNIQMGNKRLYLSRSTLSGIRIKTNAPNSYLISYINMLMY